MAIDALGAALQHRTRRLAIVSPGSDGVDLGIVGHAGVRGALTDPSGLIIGIWVWDGQRPATRVWDLPEGVAPNIPRNSYLDTHDEVLIQASLNDHATDEHRHWRILVSFAPGCAPLD